MNVDSDLQELRQSADRWDMERADLKAHIDELKLSGPGRDRTAPQDTYSKTTGICLWCGAKSK